METKPVELRDIRAEWERGLTPLTVIKIEGHTVLVILGCRKVGAGDLQPLYHCHRYFTIGDSWTCSVDGQNTPLAGVFSWLNHPSAMTTKPDNYLVPEKVEEARAAIAKAGGTSGEHNG